MAARYASMGLSVVEVVEVVVVDEVVVDDDVVVGARVVVVVARVVATVSLLADEAPEQESPLHPATARAARSSSERSSIPVSLTFIFDTPGATIDKNTLSLARIPHRGPWTRIHLSRFGA
jgi:hypothetical protein